MLQSRSWHLSSANLTRTTEAVSCKLSARTSPATEDSARPLDHGRPINSAGRRPFLAVPGGERRSFLGGSLQPLHTIDVCAKNRGRSFLGCPSCCKGSNRCRVVGTRCVNQCIL